jgi:hypothetical protein
MSLVHMQADIQMYSMLLYTHVLHVHAYIPFLQNKDN